MKDLNVYLSQPPGTCAETSWRTTRLMPLQQVKLHIVHNQKIESLDLTTALPLFRSLQTLLQFEKNICCLLHPHYFSFLAIYHHVSITRN